MTKAVSVAQREQSIDLTAFGQELRSLRKAKGATLRGLAKACGRSPGYLSQIETGSVIPSLDTVSRIATALNVELSWFFPNEAGFNDRERGIVVRKDSRRRLSRIYALDTAALGYQDFLLSADLELDLCSGLSRYEVGGRSRGEVAPGQGHMNGYVLKGRIRLIIEDEVFVLNAEDSFAVDLSRPHNIENDHDDISEVIWTMTPVHLDY
jgi:transcriptional regulator with XRE-family HTH domain